jgi:hypothetical protein
LELKVLVFKRNWNHQDWIEKTIPFIFSSIQLHQTNYVKRFQPNLEARYIGSIKYTLRINNLKFEKNEGSSIFYLILFTKTGFIGERTE